jgi:hypothetical protein
MSEATAKRPRHLMDPANPVRPRNDASLTTVQRWVASTLAVSTIGHMVVGVVLAAMIAPESALDARIGLNVIAGIFGVIAVLAARAIHGAPLRFWWLPLGLTPTPIGLWLCL